MVRDNQKVVPLRLAPAAGVTIPQFNEEDGPLVLIAPGDRLRLVLAGVNLHKRTRADQRVHGEIVEADVAVVDAPRVRAPRQGDWRLAQRLHRPRREAGLIMAGSGAGAYRKTDHLVVATRLRRQQLGLSRTGDRFILLDLIRVDSAEAHQVCDLRMVDRAQAEELANTRLGRAVLYLGEPGVGNAEPLIAFGFGNPPAGLFDFADFDIAAVPDLLELLTTLHSNSPESSRDHCGGRQGESGGVERNSVSVNTGRGRGRTPGLFPYRLRPGHITPPRHDS